MPSHRIPRKLLSPFHHFSIFTSLTDFILATGLMGSKSLANPRACKVLATKTSELIPGEGYLPYLCLHFALPRFGFFCVFIKNNLAKGLQLCLHCYQLKKLFIMKRL